MSGWRKSSRSESGNCAEVRAWRKSSRSMANGNCLEAGSGPGGVLVRDTANRGGTVLSFTAGAWAAFLAGLSGGAR